MGESFTHYPTCRLNLLGNDRLIFLLSVLGKQICHFLLIQMECRHNHMHRSISFKGDNKFPEVCLLDKDTIIGEYLVKMKFLRSHGFGFNDALDFFLLHKVSNEFHRFLGGFGNKNMSSPCLAVGLKLFDHLINVIRSIILHFFDFIPCGFEINAFISFFPLCGIIFTECSKCSGKSRVI